MPDHIRNPASLSVSEIESLEKVSLRCLFQAAIDFGFDAFDVFFQSPDEVKDVAEDITREMVEGLKAYEIQTRILGNVDYRQARYLLLPDMVVRQALFVESKAEKEQTSATLQMSETSMMVRQHRNGEVLEEKGQVPVIAHYTGVAYLTTVLLAHYHYEDQGVHHILRSVVLAAIPNGKLQDIYNPSADDTIWAAGRNASSRGESFRVRLNFNYLEAKASWRVQRINYNAGTR